MDIKELRKLTKEELTTRAQNKKQELVKSVYEVRTGVETDYSQIGKLKREIARINTILTEESYKAEK